MAAAAIVDVVLGVLAVEALALALFGRRFPGLPPFRRLWPNLAAGLFLVLAVRAAVAGYGAPLIGPLLALAGAAHVVDLVGRRR